MSFSFGVRRKPGWLAILPQDGRVMLVHIVRQAGERPQVRLLDNYAATSGVVDALQRLRTARRLDGFASTTLVAAGDCAVTQLEAPPGAARGAQGGVALGTQGCGELFG